MGGFRTMLDPELKMQKSAIASLSAEVSLKWVSSEVLVHAVLSTAFSCAVFTTYSAVKSESEPTITMMPHMILGIVLGLLLVSRVVVGAGKAAEVLDQILAFNKSLRTIAVYSTYVNETLTMSSGAELEKKAVANFRYELVRLLNLCNFCYTLTLKGLKVDEPPESLRPVGGSNLEGKVLSSVGSPTLMVCKWIAHLLDQQKGAGRITGEQVASTQAELSSLMDVYHKTRGTQLAPMPASLSSFTKFFVVLWVYTACPVIAIAELHGNGVEFNTPGTAVTAVMSFMVSLFYFGLYEAGKLMETPVETTVSLIPLEGLSYTLSDDLTNLTDDPDQAVPVFFSPAE